MSVGTYIRLYLSVYVSSGFIAPQNYLFCITIQKTITNYKFIHLFQCTELCDDCTRCTFMTTTNDGLLCTVSVQVPESKCEQVPREQCTQVPEKRPVQVRFFLQYKQTTMKNIP